MKKGFVGPLGDDIPSIFPIVAGILLFLGTFFYSVNAIDQKNLRLEVKKAAIGLGYLITEKGFMEEKEFNEKCAGSLIPFGNANSIKFVVVVKKFCGMINLTSKFYDERTTPQEDNTLSTSVTGMKCHNLKNPSELNEVLSPNSKKNPIVLSYPTSVSDPCGEGNKMINGMGWINVIVWK